MLIRTFRRSDIPQAVALWNQRCNPRDFCYKPLAGPEFDAIFLQSPHYSEEYMLALSDDDGTLRGFISGLVKREYLQGENYENTPGYLTMVLIRPELCGRGEGRRMVAELEKRFAAVGKHDIRITYRNPVALTWQIPGTPGHDHNNAPGVDMDSAAYHIFQKLGYRTQQIELGMYRELSGYVSDERCSRKESRLAGEGISIEMFDSSRHFGFEELFDNLHGEVWRKNIRDNLARKEPLPVIVAVDGGRIIGFAGPIARQDSGRGWFNGIAVHSDYQRRGIALVMFDRLMREFRLAGARFSTLFTDDKNPAYALYRSVGFRTVKTWAVMNKELKQNG